MNTNKKTAGVNPWLRLKRHFVEAFTGDGLSTRQAGDGESSDGWRDVRRRHAYRYILGVLACVFVPLIIHDISVGRILPSVGLLLLLSLVMIDIVRLSRKLEAQVAPQWLLLICIGLNVLSLRDGVHFSLYLFFPLVAFMPILVRMRWAAGLGILCMLGAWPFVAASAGWVNAALYELSLGLCFMICAWLVFSLKQQTRRLRGMATTDPLTGAYNRRYLELQAERAFEAYSRYGTPVTLVIMDIDHFKRINDGHGHSAGDQVLKAFVECISERIRKTDFLYRFGGEEFVLLLTETSCEEATQLAEQLRQAVAERPMLPQGKITMSVGVCEASIAHHTQHWFRLADNALYAAKSEGRNCVQVATGAKLKVVPLSKSVPQWR